MHLRTTLKHFCPTLTICYLQGSEDWPIIHTLLPVTMAQSISTRKCHIYILQMTYKIRNTKSIVKGSDDAHYTQDYQVPGLCPSSSIQTTPQSLNCINTFPMWGRVAPSSVRLQTSDNICMSTDSNHLKYEF